MYVYLVPYVVYVVSVDSLRWGHVVVSLLLLRLFRPARFRPTVLELDTVGCCDGPSPRRLQGTPSMREPASPGISWGALLGGPACTLPA